MRKYYSIADKRICIDFPYEFADCENWHKFEIGECEPHINVVCKVAEKLPGFDGEWAKGENDISVLSSGNTIYRSFSMGALEGAVTAYSKGVSCKAETFLTERSHSILMDTRYMWNTIALPQLLLGYGVLMMHASYIEYKGKAILFSAPCGTGKSTQADLWAKHRGATIVNGDKAAVMVDGGKVFATGLPFCGTSGICLNRTLPLSAIVLLKQAPVNEVELLKGVGALQGVLSNIYLDFLADGEALACAELLDKILSDIPVYELRCTPDEGAVEALEKEMYPDLI